MDLTTSALRLLRPSEPLTTTEIVLCAVASLALAAAPGIAWLRYLLARVWSSTPRVLDLLNRVFRVLSMSFIAYAVALLLARLFGSALRANPGGSASPGWGLLASIAALGAGVATTWYALRAHKQRGD